MYKKSVASLTLSEAAPFSISQETCAGLLKCRWPGRNQILSSTEGHIKYFLDGAHTAGSMAACVEWYKNIRPSRFVRFSVLESFSLCLPLTLFNLMCIFNLDRPGVKQALLFNMTGDRDRLQVMEPLLSCAFDKVIFSPNIVRTSSQGTDG